MQYGLCGFLIIKPQTALHHAVWCDAVHYYLRYSAVMPFCRRFWCGFCGLYGLVNTPKDNFQKKKKKQQNDITNNYWLALFVSIV